VIERERGREGERERGREGERESGAELERGERTARLSSTSIGPPSPLCTLQQQNKDEKE
jgi:hypothetical protein